MLLKILFSAIRELGKFLKIIFKAVLQVKFSIHLVSCDVNCTSNAIGHMGNRLCTNKSISFGKSNMEI